MAKLTTDYVIVGAGAAGAVLAHRLVKAGRSVLLLEAGPADDLPAIHATDLGSMTSMWGPCPQNWGYETVPQPGLGGRKVAIAQGRVLGGGSAINAMMYVRGNRRDYDGWAAQGAVGWSYDEILPLFARSESYVGGDAAFRGRSGPLAVIDYPDPSEASTAFIAAADEVGLSSSRGDYNGARQENIAFTYQSTRIDRARRCSTATAFLDPLRGHPLLTIETGVQVTRVRIDGRRATGVDVIRNGKIEAITAGREVVLSAGAFASPHLLMLSGIGPAAHLREHGVNVVQDLPGVGENLHDHLLLGLACKATKAFSAPQLLSEAGLFLRSSRARADASPDLQFFFGPIYYGDPQYREDGPAFTLVPIVVQPKSRGRVTLASADPMALPLVDPAYLTHPDDVAVLVEGLRIGRNLTASAAMAPLFARELAPGAAVVDDEALAAYARANASTVWHPVGTCRMGAADDPAAVVDPLLRVHGISGLRVADASIMPTITSGNTNAPTILIGEKAADLILSSPSA